MADKGKQQYYVGGKSYCPDDATSLCKYAGIFERVTLYQSQQGAFFTMEESIIDGTAVKVLSKAAARSFMDEHAAGIDTGNYNRIFGEPKQG